MKIRIIRKRVGTLFVKGIHPYSGELLTTKDASEASNLYTRTGQRAASLATKLYPKARIAVEEVKHAPRGRWVSKARRGRPRKVQTAA